MTFYQHMLNVKGELYKASLAWCKERGMSREDWYRTWQTTSLPRVVEASVKKWNQGAQARKNG